MVPRNSNGPGDFIVVSINPLDLKKNEYRIMQCSYSLNGRQCKLRTHDPGGLCHFHRFKSKYDKPLECPICLGSLSQTKKPLECGHWVHRSCLERTGKAQCPICRAKLSGYTQKPIEPETLIPDHAATLAVVTFQLYSNIVNPYNPGLGLDFFVEGISRTIADGNEDLQTDIATVLFAQALFRYFETSVVTIPGLF